MNAGIQTTLADLLEAGKLQKKHEVGNTHYITPKSWK